MPIAKTKQRLLALLKDEGNKVIALSGLWGTGKSHLWAEVQEESGDELVNGALYVSLFGLSSISQVKQKLVIKAAPVGNGAPRLVSYLKQKYEPVANLLKNFHPGFSAMLDAPLLLAPSLLSKKMIVIDDIERKHSALDVDELMGFIDEFTTIHGSRFLLILNSDQLSQLDAWEKLREKVIDQELVLDTTSEEAYKIAVGERGVPYGDAIEVVVKKCQITNIRIVRRVVKAVNTILGGGDEELGLAIQDRVIPSIVLLTAVHLRGLPDGPSTEYILQHGSIAAAILEEELAAGKNESAEKARELKEKKKWESLLLDLGISSADEFEQLVVEFLQTGSVEPDELRKIIDRYKGEDAAMRARLEVGEFYGNLHWNHRITEGDLVEAARRLVARMKYMGPGDATALVNAVEGIEYEAAGAVAGELRQAWIAALNERGIAGESFDDPFRRPIDPAFEEAMKRIDAKIQSRTSIYDACFAIASRSGWGVRETTALRNASVDDFLDLFSTASPDELRTVLRQMVGFSADLDNYKNHFGGAMESFIEASKHEIRERANGRLSTIIRGLFSSAGISELLE